MVSRQSAALSSATHAMPPEFGGKWEMECLNTLPSAYPAECGIQREAKKNIKSGIHRLLGAFINVFFYCLGVMLFVCAFYSDI